ncbi:MAG TPA: hydantoinase B/oxoprolinase family protein, partial [Thermomicrobiaceae bacterium]|nr:hydantoinase B/oxoprolinase family protein [Thermomicrobiaceae bacterium]
PVLVRRYALRDDSAGPGYYRGGVGVELELTVFPPNGVITSRGMERYRFRPWGRRGGRAGTLGYTRLNPGTEREREIGKIDVLYLQPGDTVRIGAQGGGGYGDPLERPAGAVLDDVLDALVSREHARQDYGVVLAGDEVDERATAQLRAELRAARPDTRADFDFGPEREDYEAAWTPALQDAILAATWDYPVHLRHFLRDRLFAEIAARLTKGAVEPVLVPELLAAIIERELAGRGV